MAITELTRLSASEAAHRIASGALTSEEFVGACIERICQRENAVRAWALIAPDVALEQARRCDQSTPRGPLHGVPVGVKDIFDTVDMPTSYGSALYAGHRPSAEAACVARLRRAGAVILGKTATTELALYHPSPTRNPHDQCRTPGGSSSGSAAAVADEMVPLALGSQTAGSTIRPAAFCGIVGFKPTFGAISRAGMKPVSPSLDTVGLFAREIADVRLLLEVLAGPDPINPATALYSPSAHRACVEGVRHQPHIGFLRTPYWSEAEAMTREALEKVASRLSSHGAAVQKVSLPPRFYELVDAQKTIMNVEAAQSLCYEYEQHRDKISDTLRTMLELSYSIPSEDYQSALRLTAGCRDDLASLFEHHDVLMTPSVPGEAPLGLNSTGDPIFCRTWTLLGCPAISVPGLHGPNGLPLGLQLVGRPGSDGSLLAYANWIAQRL